MNILDISTRYPLRSWLKGSQCDSPPQGGTGCGEINDITLPYGWSCIEQDQGLIKNSISNGFRFFFQDKQTPSENLGQIVFGERIRSSAYSFDFADSNCVKVCSKNYPTSNKAATRKLHFLQEAIIKGTNEANKQK